MDQQVHLLGFQIEKAWNPEKLVVTEDISENCTVNAKAREFFLERATKDLFSELCLCFVEAKNCVFRKRWLIFVSSGLRYTIPEQYKALTVSTGDKIDMISTALYLIHFLQGFGFDQNHQV
jgi:hypothetical protein